MKFFLDTANLEQIKEAASWGLLDGVTTNPTLISKEDLNFEALIKIVAIWENREMSHLFCNNNLFINRYMKGE